MGTAFSPARSQFWDNNWSLESDDPKVRPIGPYSRPVPRRRPSLLTRAFRGLARFVIAVGIGVGSTLAWQAYGDIAREMIATASPQLAEWLPPSTLIGPATLPVPRAPFAQTASATVGTGGSVALPDPQQLEAMNRGLLAVRQRVDQLAAQFASSQQQMALDIARLQASEQDILARLPGQKPAAAPPPGAQSRKPQAPVALVPPTH